MGIVHGDRTLKEVVEERERNRAATGYQIDGAFIEALVDKRTPITRQFALGDKTPDPAAAEGQRPALVEKRVAGLQAVGYGPPPGRECGRRAGHYRACHDHVCHPAGETG